tara:strand:+ start:134 stop:877 length:744 start_codon:yes stop_codon:yes gene_type:complete
MNPHYPKPRHHSRRFYILVTTVVVGAIMLLLLVNDGKLSLTGSTVGILGGSTVSKEGIKLNSETTSGSSEATRNVKVNFNYNAVPKFKQDQIKLTSLLVKFNDPQTKIGINEETLELKGLKSAELEIGDYQGSIDFDGTSISLQGQAGRLKVNGIGISTKKTMKLSFSGLVYDSLRLSGANMASLSFAEGDGSMKVKQKFSYQFAYDDKITLTNYQGSFYISDYRMIYMDGVASSVSAQGEFNLNLS